MVALLLAASVAGVYVRRAWQAHQALKSAPSSVPAAVSQQSAAFSFSKVDGDHTEFTLRAAHATEFAGGDRSVLDDVWVTMYGKDGTRSDNLHTRSCEYLVSTGSILCSGDVQIDLQSAEDAHQFPLISGRPNPGAHIAHVSTSQVTFNRKDGTAVTSQPVTFQFPQGEGRAVGLHYDSQQGELQLLHNVDFTLRHSLAQPANHPASAPPAPSTGAPVSLAISAQNPSPTPPGDDPLHLCGSSLLYRRDDRVIHLQGPVLAQQNTRQLQSGQLAVELDADLHVHRIIATDHPKLQGAGAGGPVTITADQLSAAVSPEGWVDQLIATGNVHAVAHGTQSEDRMDAGRADIEMVANANRPAQLVATQNVVAESLGPAGLRRTLNTATLTMDFAADTAGGQSHIRQATTPEATLDWQSQGVAGNDAASKSDKSQAQHVHMVSQHLDADFDAAGEIRQVRGTGGVQVERQIGAGPVATSTSREMLARTLPGGDWSSVDQSGDVHLRQLDRSAQAELAHFDRLTDTAVLSGSSPSASGASSGAGQVVLADSQSRVTAQQVTFHQLANEFHAEGHVVSSEVSAQNGGATNLAPVPARISADNLVVNTQSGQALYSGQARLWQGDSLIQADTILLDRTTHVLTATGHVRAVFPQAAWQPSGGINAIGQQPPPKSPVSTPNAKPDASKSSSAKMEYWRAEANHLTYDSDQGKGRLEQNVYTHSAEGGIRADSVDLFFAPEPAGPATLSSILSSTGSPDTRGIATPGAQQLVRATAVGKVLVEQEDRHGTGSRAEYTASEGKFVLSGGPPIVYDSSGNSTTGRQLTLFFADDRIVIDSAEGLRTLTLHRVGK